MSTAHVSKEEQEQGVFDEDSCFSAAASSTSNPTFSTSTSASTAAVAAVAAASTAAVTTTSTATPTASTSSSSSSPPPSISVSASASATTSASGAVGGHRIFGPNDNGNNNLFTASKSLLGRDGTGSSSDTDDGPSLTAIRQKLRHFFRLRNDVAQAREASIKAFELAVPPVAPVPAHQSESNVCDSQPKCRDIGLQRDCPSRRMAKAALLSVWTREYVSQAQHIQERKNFMRKVVTQTQVNAKKLQAQKMLLNTLDRLHDHEVDKNCRVMLDKVRGLFATTPIVAVRLTPTEVEWVFRFEVLQHSSGGSAHAGSSFGTASSDDGNNDQANTVQQGYTRHHESAVATVHALLEAIVSVLFVEGVPLTIPTLTTQMRMTNLPTSASPGNAVAGLRLLCIQAKDWIPSWESIKLQEHSEIQAAAETDVRDVMKLLAGMQYLSTSVTRKT